MGQAMIYKKRDNGTIGQANDIKEKGQWNKQ
jgi:hypothetical protein